MKKLRGIMAILAATALIFGTVACSDGGGNDNNNNNNPEQPSGSDPTQGSGTSDPVTGGGGSEGGDEAVSLVYKAEEITVAELNAMNPVPSAGTSTKLAAGTYSIWGGSGAIVTADKKMAVQIDTGKTTPKAIVSATNMSGSTASAVPVVGANLSSIIKDATGDKAPVNYVKVATPAAGKYAITLNISTDASTKALEAAGLSYWILATDEAGTILAVKDIGDIQQTSVTYAAEDVVVGTATLGENVCLGFARGAGSGGLKIHSITLTSEDTNAASMTISADKTSAKVGEKVTWSLTAKNMDVPSTVDIYVDGSGTPFITGAALTDGKYEMTVKEAWLEEDEDKDPTETTVKVFVKSGDVSSNKVTITFEPADNILLYKDLTPADFESDFTAAELAYLNSMTDAEIDTYVEGYYTDAACKIPVTQGYEGDIYIKLNKTKAELKALIDAAIAAATKYTVKFYINTTDTEPAYTVTDVVSGTPLTDAQLTAAKAALVKEDFTLAGLYTDKNLKTEFVETDGITGDTSVYAKWNAVVYFSSFVATDTGKTADTGYEALTSSDGLVATTARAKFQLNNWSTHDYNAETGAGYTYTARVKLNKKSGDVDGTLTISNVKVGSVLRIDGGNSSTDVRTVAFTGTDTDSTKWEASTMGTIYVTATASTVVLTSETNEFCIYGIHVVDEKVATSVLTTVTTYTKPTVELSASSCVLNEEVIVTTTVPDAAIKTTYSDGKVVSSTIPVTAPLTYAGATVTDGKVDTSTAGTYSITASYTVDETTYKSDAVTLEVSAGFAVSTETIANNEDTLGLVATSVESSATGVATVALNDGIVITSVAAGTATITFTDGTNSGTIDVTVSAGGDITATVNKYSSVTQWYVIGADTETAATFTNKAITLSKSSGIYLPVTYATGKKVKLTFTVDMASVNADTGSKICGGFAQDDTFANTKYATFASNKGISNGSKPWNNGGSSNGYNGSTKMYTGETAAVADVTFSVEYTIGQESSDGSDIVMTVTISDGTTSDSKTVKQKDMKWGGTAGTVQASVVPYIYFGAGKTDSITVSNISLTVDGEAVNTSAN